MAVKMTQPQEDIFYSFIRLAIWHDEEDYGEGRTSSEWSALLALMRGLASGKIGWRVLVDTYKAHSLLGFVADAIMSLPDDLLPPEDIRKEIIRYSGNLVRAHWSLDSVIADLFGKLEAEGLHPVLLKGQGFSRLYPMSRTRSCGDIDFHCPGDEFYRAAEVMNSLCEKKYDREEQEDCEHHLNYEYDGIEIELHRWVTSTAYDIVSELVNRWAMPWMQPSRCHFVRIGKKDVRVPDNYFSFIYCIDHLFKHLRYEGIGIRQFVDLVMLYKALKELSGGVDNKMFNEDLRVCHLAGFWKVEQSVMTLFMPEDNLVRCRMSKERLRKVRRYLLESGNFGREYDAISPETYVNEPHGVKRILAIAHYNHHKYDHLRVFSFWEYLRATRDEFLFSARGSIRRRFG